jgi:hypothetical protein
VLCVLCGYHLFVLLYDPVHLEPRFNMCWYLILLLDYAT